MTTQFITIFYDHKILLSGAITETAVALKNAILPDDQPPPLIFDDATGLMIDLDLHGTDEDVVERLSQAPRHYNGQYRTIDPETISEAQEPVPRGRGRPKLGVVSREITLLPRQWAWLNEQPGGASAVIRRLVDEAKNKNADTVKKRLEQEAAYNFLHSIAGDLSGYEEAIRALFADNQTLFEQSTAHWPEDIGAYAMKLAYTHSVNA